MKNIFSDILAKISKRRKKKGKPQPVVPEPIKAVAYNRCDGHVSGGLIQAGVVWDNKDKVYKGGKVGVAQKRPPIQQTRKRRDEVVYAESTIFDPAFFHISEETSSERGYTAPESASGYDYPRETVSPAYVAPSPSYESPTYSAPSSSNSYSSTDSGSSGGGYGGGGE